MNRNEATADCECGYASGSAPRLSSQAVSQKSAWNHKQSLRTASFLRSIPQIASSREHAFPGRAAESNHSVDMPVAHPLAAFGRALSLRSLLRTALARRGATPAGVSLSLSLSLSWPVALTGTGGSKTRSQRQPACPARERERAGERGRGRERERERELPPLSSPRAGATATSASDRSASQRTCVCSAQSVDLK
jgi:hypothetical protein